MKRIIYSIVFLFIVFNLFAQDNLQLIDTSKMWSTLSYSSWMPSMHMTRYNKFLGDTLINQTEYMKVWEATDEGYSNWILKGFIREDTNGNILLRTLYDEEGLIYKFNVNSGDNLTINNPFYCTPCPTTVLDVDSVFIELSNEWRKRITLAPINPYGSEEYWIEGIGSLAGILHSSYHILPLTGGGYDLLCYWENESLIYSNPDYNFCYSSTVSSPDISISETGIIIYPNPVVNQSRISINFPNKKNIKIEIRDIWGKLIKRFQVNSSNEIILNRSQFNSGLYIISINDENKIIAQKKLIVQ
jgi:hypothetical protein